MKAQLNASALVSRAKALTPAAAAVAVVIASGGAVAQQRIADDVALPPNAVAGECYARVFVPAQYETVSETVLIREGEKKLESTKAEYEWVEEQVLVEEESTELEIVPAEYEWLEEQVLVKEASEEIVIQPASYDEAEEQVLVRAAYTTWKKGRGLVEKVDDATGEIMCLVEVPGEYKSVKKRVVTSPERIEKITIPAEYRTVKKRAVKTPPQTRTVTIPAKYETVRVQKVAAPATSSEVEIPAEYSNVEKTVLVEAGYMEWRAVLCETNARPALVTDIQRALREKGYNPGPIDGVIGRDTADAVAQFQGDQNMASGGLTMETIRALGLNP